MSKTVTGKTIQRPASWWSVYGAIVGSLASAGYQHADRFGTGPDITVSELELDIARDLATRAHRIGQQEGTEDR